MTGGGGSSAVGVNVARQLLTKFAFPASRWQDDVAKLSGGERRRLQLLACLAARPNVLVLDEPTNDLDIATLTRRSRCSRRISDGVLEEYLDEYRGVLLVVSHDRYFCDRVLAPPAPEEDEDDDEFESRPSSLFVFEGGGAVSKFAGVYSEYFELLKSANGWLGRATRITGFASPPPLPVKKALEEEEAKKKAEKAKKVKVSKKDRDEYATIEVEVERLEVAAVKAQAALDQANSAARRLSSREMLEIASAASAARRAADEKMERYMYLEELISQADA
ncbi:ABC protein involved in -independent precise excision of transposon [Chrysochromulina tobinii]|uniref:ABC protein involved in-independent precise excision of transposon n=1 Tax=Chrysochromulina tobinii TaxID=1460289 RepID=A0A0M0K7U5_9EUKA|nr:ABC protein involved in -independent precise excision of transposon [Chrysochromulina tobinii]|eukprot:KOO34895.1 ABC protein involved in -independent precise excision of transposon [Chrysochromulina sp. CCMP291]